ncbi:hypothetical protein [Marispirochaeta aestuarii]|nr:hypothetical protein [Marispirochaeta aestuarii]
MKLKRKILGTVRKRLNTLKLGEKSEPVLQDPREFLYSNLIPRFTVELPVKKGRYLGWFDLDREGFSPIILALHNWNQNGKNKESFYGILALYAKVVVIDNPNKKLFFNSEFTVFPEKSEARRMIYPWDTGSVESRYNEHLEKVRKENKKYGLMNSFESIGDINSCSDKKLKMEAERFCRLAESIGEYGYKKQPRGQISGSVYLAGPEYVWAVDGGHHRAPVLSYLGYERIPVVVRRFVRREEVAFWPQVVSGLYSEEAALHVFDNFFYSRQPDSFNEWKEHPVVEEIRRKNIK